jgi:hypothetical protein
MDRCINLNAMLCVLFQHLYLVLIFFYWVIVGVMSSILGLGMLQSGVLDIKFNTGPVWANNYCKFGKICHYKF